MYNFEFQNQGTNAYLVYKIGDDVLENISFNMITNNKIKGLAPLVFTQINNDRYLRYNITSKRPLSSFLEQPVSKKSILNIFLNITNSFVYADEYMIESTFFILDPQYIFVDITNCETSVICLPLINEDINTDNNLTEFFRKLINSAKPLPTDSMAYIGEIMGFLNSSKSFSIHDFVILLNRLLNDTPAIQPAAQPSKPATPAPQPIAVAAAVPSTPPLQKTLQETLPQPMQQKPPTPPVQSPFAQQQIPKQNGGIPIPNSNKMPPVNNLPNIAQNVQEEEITWVYLMQHYNAENKAKYDAQKARKKAQKSGNVSPTPLNTTMPSNQPAMPLTPVMQKPQNNNNPPIMQSSPVMQTAPASHPSAPTLAPNNNENFGGTVDLRTYNQQNVIGASLGGSVLGGGYSQGTTVLSPNAAPISSTFLIRSKNRENIPLTGERFRIGKERSQVEYFIADNTNISRNHVDIINENSEYFVIDIGSTNGTFLNGVRVTPHTKVKLTNGDILRLANEEFEFIKK